MENRTDTAAATAEASFGQRVMAELLSLPRKNACCRRAFLYGMLMGGGKHTDDGIRLRVRGDAQADAAIRLCREQFGREAVLLRRKGAESGVLCFSSPAAEKMLAGRVLCGDVYRCSACRGAFVGGLFLSCGSVNDPEKDNYLSFRVANDRADPAEELLLSASVPVKRTENAGKTVFYLRAAEPIQDTLGLCGLQKTFFDFCNRQIRKEFRNNANRHSNSEYRNIAKATSAAKKYCDAIAYLTEHDRMTGLPPEIAEAARLRLEDPYSSLAALGAMMSPPVTKSGMAHRLNKILEIYEASKKENK